MVGSYIGGNEEEEWIGVAMGANVGSRKAGNENRKKLLLRMLSRFCIGAGLAVW